MKHQLTIFALSSALVLQPLSLLAAPPAPGIRPAGVQAPAATGTITGTARSASGQTLPSYTVQVRNLETGQLAGTTSSSASGGFSFTGLSPATYVVEILNPAGVVVGTSTATALTAGATAVVAVSAAAVAGAAVGAGVSTALIIATVAAAAGIAGVVVVARDNASPSE